MLVPAGVTLWHALTPDGLAPLRTFPRGSKFTVYCYGETTDYASLPFDIAQTATTLRTEVESAPVPSVPGPVKVAYLDIERRFDGRR